MDLAIVNTTNLTQQIQVRGRIRHDIDLLVVRTKDQNLPKMKIILENPLQFETNCNIIRKLVAYYTSSDIYNELHRRIYAADLTWRHK